jgi:pilus assembly protein CpaE
VISREIRQLLAKEGVECPAAHVMAPELAGERLPRSKPDLVLVVLGSDPEKSLAGLAEAGLQAPARVLAVGPTTDPKLVIRALRAGADDYVDVDELETHLREALARCRFASQAQQANARLIAVLAPSGGSGSSTIAVNVATVLAKEHKQAVLLDLKLQAGDLAALLDLKPAHSLADLCQNIGRMDRTLFERTLEQHSSGVFLLAPPRHLADVKYITAEGVRQVLALARARFPYVVADLDHSFRDEQMVVLRQADIILLVLRLDFTALRNARRTLDYFETLGIDKERVRLVINRFGQAKEVPAARAEEALRVKISHYVPDEPRTVNRANNNGVPVVLESPAAKVSKSVAKLAASVNGRHIEHATDK